MPSRSRQYWLRMWLCTHLQYAGGFNTPEMSRAKIGKHDMLLLLYSVRMNTRREERGNSRNHLLPKSELSSSKWIALEERTVYRWGRPSTLLISAKVRRGEFYTAKPSTTSHCQTRVRILHPQHLDKESRAVQPLEIILHRSKKGAIQSHCTAITPLTGQ